MGGCLGRKTRRQVSVADVGDVVVDGDLPGRDSLNVAASLSCEVNNNASRLHVINHVFLDQDGSLLARNKGCSDHDINILALVVEQLHLCLDELLRHLLGITSLSAAVLLNLHLQELASHRLDLLLYSRPHIKAPDNGTHAFGLTHSCKTCYSTTNDKHLSWGHFPCSSDLSSEEPAKVVAGLDHSSVTRDVAHGGESVEDLRPRDPGHAVHTKGCDLLGRQGLDQVGVLSRVEEGVKGRLIPQQGHLLKAGLPKF